MGQTVIGVDIGGTKTDCVLLSPQGEVLAERHLLTQPADGAEVVLDRIAAAIRSLMDEAPLPPAAIGVGSPGLIDPERGIVLSSVNLGWTNVPLRDALLARLETELPLSIQNDVKAGALGERYFGAGRGVGSLVYIAIGTGLGGALMLGDRLITGAGYLAMELGHFALYPDGRACPCGLHGCPEQYLSGVGLTAGAQAHYHNAPNTTLSHDALTAPAVLAAARAGDPLACRVIDEAADCLARLIAVCAAVVAPERVIIGGGLGLAAADLLIPAAQQQLARLLLPPLVKQLTLCTAQQTRLAVGAACLALAHQDGIET